MSYSVVDVVKDKLLGRTEYVEDHEKQARLDTCAKCPDRNPRLNTCKVCGCWLPSKASHRRSSCPKGKW